MNDAAPTQGPWTPLATPMFRWFWLAVLVSNIGTWIDATAAAWVMAGLSPSPLMVSLVQAAGALPMVLLALPAGALADIVDRRRLLVGCQLFMLLAAVLLALAAFSGRLDAPVLLALTLMLNIGAALATPAMAATTPELVPRAQLAGAVALNSLGMNIARAIGPALGGLILVQLGAGWAFAINAVTFLGVIVVFLAWRRAPAGSRLPPERFVGALRAGLRYAARAPAFRAVLLRALAFFAFATAGLALLPLLVRAELGFGATVYGLSLTAMGGGAIVGALLLPRIRAHLSRSTMVAVASAGFAAALLLLSRVVSPWQLYAVLALMGLCWIAVLASLQVAAQTSVPGWVRGRALALYLTVFSLGSLLGSVGWGAVATRYGMGVALDAAALGALLAMLATLRLRLDAGEAMDLMPSAHWPQPVVVAEVADDRGPVLVAIEYEVPSANRPAFMALMHDLGARRRRDGALAWGVFEDVAESALMVEQFTVGSWLEHLRQHERVTADDRALQDRIRALLAEGRAPRVRHLVGGPPGGSLSAHRPDHADA